MTDLLDSANLRNRVNTLGLRAAQLAGRHASDLETQATLTTKVSEAKGRAALAPQVASIFEGMQHLSHKRSVGSLESLLSAILNDVLPNEGNIRLMTSYKANSTHLDIMLEKQGRLEDVLDGNGGAVTNIVCAGLRFAALSRTGNRKLMVMDEPDCWVSLDRAPEFARTVSQIALKGGFQTFVITHKARSNFENHYNIVKFSENADGKVEAHALSPQVTHWESDEQPGLRKIELINVRRHEHTVVPCFPGPTAYVGKSNLGKSTALMSAFKMVAYGESDDSVIRHGCEEAKVIFHLENNQRLEWSRHVKRSPAVIYKHFRGDELIAEGRPKTRNQAPEWVEELLGVCRVDDMDIQVGNQKKPVFLLDDSAPRRAQILSVGRESSYLPGLMRAYEQMKAADRELIKQGETELARLKLRLTYLQKVPKLVEGQKALAAQAEAILKKLETRERLNATLARMEVRGAAVAKLEATVAVLAELPEVPVLASTEALARTIARLEKSGKYAQVGELPVLPDIPTLKDLARITELGSRIAKANRALAAADSVNLKVPELPLLADNSALSARIELLTRRMTTAGACETALKAAEAEVASATAALNKLIDELGQSCPLCGGVMSHEHAETAHAH